MSQSPEGEIYAILWSGGKDSCLALWRARQAGLRVNAMVNFIDENSRRVRFHAIRSELIGKQAHALNLEFLQYSTAPDSFASSFQFALDGLKTSGYTGVVAGDIHLEDVRRWNEERTDAAGLKLIEPLWGDDGQIILQSLIGAGFRAVLTCCDDKWQSVLWPGREIDARFVEDVSSVTGLDVCGERGEYHSFVYDGPLFSRPVAWLSGEIHRRNGFSQIDLLAS